MSKLAEWLQIGANLGIFAGLILVGAQMFQSNEIAGAQLFDSTVESTIAVNLALLGETPELSMHRILYEPESATPNDFSIADGVYTSVLRQLVRADLFTRLNLYGNQETDTRGFAAANHPIFASPYGLAYLDQAMGHIPPQMEDMQEAMNLMRKFAADRMENGERADRVQRMETILEQLKR